MTVSVRAVGSLDRVNDEVRFASKQPHRFDPLDKNCHLRLFGIRVAQVANRQHHSNLMGWPNGSRQMGRVASPCWPPALGFRGSKRFRPCHQGEPHGSTTAARVKRRTEGKLGESHIALVGADCTPVIWNLSQLCPGKTRRLLSCRRLVRGRAYHNTCANAYVHGMEE